jgi:orotidine-5'-phosphate decarboxylase
MSDAKDKLIIALDVPTADEARELVAQLRGVAGMFKIGSQLFTAAGPSLAREIAAQGERVFLDLKFHDIPNTVAAAGVEAARLGVAMFNVHAAGGGEMMRRVSKAVKETAEREGLAKPVVLGVTVLTSSDAATLAEIGLSVEPKTQVERLARLANESGLDGVVASPQEITLARETTREDFVIVTPGVRPYGAARDDQKRVMTPAEAVRAGANYIVIGRPVIKASDPLAAAQAIIEEVRQAQTND